MRERLDSVLPSDSRESLEIDFEESEFGVAVYLLLTATDHRNARSAAARGFFPTPRMNQTVAEQFGDRGLHDPDRPERS